MSTARNPMKGGLKTWTNGLSTILAKENATVGLNAATSENMMELYGTIQSLRIEKMSKIVNFKGVFVPERDILEALKLVKELREKTVYRAIHPVATRIALKYALMVDDEFAKQQLTPEQDAAINEAVQKLYKIANE